MTTHPKMHLCFGTTPTVQQTMIFNSLVPDEVNRAVRVLRSAAGKSVNVGRVLHTLGDAALVCAPLGGDTGKFLAADLTAQGVALDAVPTESPTRTCVTVINQTDGTVTELIEEHAPISIATRDAMLAKLKLHLPGGKSLVLSGTLAPGTGDDFYSACCALAAKAALPIVLDAKGPPLLNALPNHPMVVKPNRSELSHTLGVEIADDPAMRWAIGELVGRGAQWAVITMGKEGAVASDGKSFWKIPAIEVNAVSAIGSGDAFSAGLASAIAAGQEVPEACRLGAACAAANTLIAGSGCLRAEDVNRLHASARVEKW
jgi:1-phosphofructokinase family hexose kinase